jgi:hypothetical protein
MTDFLRAAECRSGARRGFCAESTSTCGVEAKVARRRQIGAGDCALPTQPEARLSGKPVAGDLFLSENPTHMTQARNPDDQVPARQVQSNPAPEFAWDGGRWRYPVEKVMERSQIRSSLPLLEDWQSMPLGSGPFGGMAWSQEGFTSQWTRNDSLPDLLSSGRLVIPSLAGWNEHADYSARLDLHSAKFEIRSGSRKLVCLAPKGTNWILIQLSGLPPGSEVDVDLRLWSESLEWDFRSLTDGSSSGRDLKHGVIHRSPSLFEGRDFVAMTEQFSGSAIRPSSCVETQVYSPPRGFCFAVTSPGGVVGKELAPAPALPDAWHIARLKTRASQEGTAEIRAALIPACGQDVEATAAVEISRLLDDSLVSQAVEQHERWWREFWNRSLLCLDSPDGEAVFVETVRNIHLYALASSTHELPPAAGGGSTSVFGFNRDWHDWGVSIYHWNTRNFYFSTLAADCPDLRAAYSNFYLEKIPAWVEAAQRNKAPGLLVPEVTYPRSTGNLVDDGRFVSGIITNNLELSAELLDGIDAWGMPAHPDKTIEFLEKTVAFWRYRLARGEDGKLQVRNSAAHETYVYVDDPMQAIAGIRSVFPRIAAFLKGAGTDPELPLWIESILGAVADFGFDSERGCIGDCAREAEARHEHKIRNVQNCALDAVFPYGFTSPGWDWRIAFGRRKFRTRWTWSTDALVSARLGLTGWNGGDGTLPVITSLLETHLKYPCGLANFVPSEEGDDLNMPMMEFTGLAAAFAQELVLQSHTGVLRIGSGLPRGWSGIFRLLGAGGNAVSGRIDREGQVTHLAVESRLGNPVRLLNPWAGPVGIREEGGETVPGELCDGVLSFQTRRGVTYSLSRADAPEVPDVLPLPSAPVPRRLGKCVLGNQPKASLPDLQLLEARFVRNDGGYVVKAEVHNGGDVHAGAFNVAAGSLDLPGDGLAGEVRVDAGLAPGATICVEIPVPELLPSQDQKRSFDLPFPPNLGTARQHLPACTLCVEVDPDHQIPDGNRFNNVKRIPWPEFGASS